MLKKAGFHPAFFSSFPLILAIGVDEAVTPATFKVVIWRFNFFEPGPFTPGKTV